MKPKTTIYDITRTKADYLYISPSNTYPLGDVIKIKDRDKLIRWAKENNSYIIEDDYNFFIRYNSYSIPSIYGQSNGTNVIYMGSFSKMIIPSIRISYMILPEDIYNKYTSIFENFSQGVSKLDQLSLAQFMKEGLFKRHTKKLYAKYKEKNEAILTALKKQQKRKNFDILSTESNLHVVLDFVDTKDYKSFTKNCSRFRLKYDTISTLNQVIFPYSGIEVKDINKLIKDLFYSI
jgi:GntR family transcriptional regulator/MocR family aminotransferase